MEERKKTTTIVIHCSATRTSQRYSFNDCKIGHISRGWLDIGYHYYIERDGTIRVGRGLYEKGAHSPIYNSVGVGICYEGGLDDNSRPTDNRTDAQKASLKNLVMGLCLTMQGEHEIKRIIGHRAPDFNSCPCFDAQTEYEELLKCIPR